MEEVVVRIKRMWVESRNQGEQIKGKNVSSHADGPMAHGAGVWQEEQSHPAARLPVEY